MKRTDVVRHAGWQRVRASIMVLLLPLTLAGCFDMRQDLTIVDGDHAELRVRLAVDAAIIAMSTQNGKPDTFCDSATSPRFEGVEYAMVRTAEGGDFVCSYTMTGPIEALSRMLASNQVLGAPQGADAQERPTMAIALSAEGDNYRFAVSVPMSAMFPDDQPENGMDMKPMMAAMLAGRSLSWSVTAPTIVETNGTLSEDGNTVSFSAPLAMGLAEGQSDPEFHVVFAAQKPGRFLGLF